jgi:hypothetical protein
MYDEPERLKGKLREREKPRLISFSMKGMSERRGKRRPKKPATISN